MAHMQAGFHSHLGLALFLCAMACELPAANFVVDNAGSQSDGNLADNLCDIQPGVAGQHCTLRAAMQQANSSAGADQISFDPSVTTITLTLPLPQGTSVMTIDGASPGAIGGRVELNGNNTIGAIDFIASGQGSTIKNLVIRNFNDDGIAIVGHGYTIDNNYIGVTPLGSAASRNTGDGINIAGLAAPPANIPTLGLPSDMTNIATITADIIAAFVSIPPNHISNNLVSGNDGDGIDIFSENAAVNIVSNNRIGTNATGLAAIPNGTGGGDGHGVRISSFSYANVIGPANLISGNSSDPNSHGVALIAGAVRYPNFVSGNIIGPSSAILSGLGNSVHGVFVDTRPQTSAPPNNPTNLAAVIGPGNVIGFNGDPANIADADLEGEVDAGISISGASARVRVYGNLIGVAEDPASQGSFVDIGNRGDGIAISTADHEIGGIVAPLRNAIAGNDRHGISVRGSAVHSVRILGNLIGLDPSQTAQPNAKDGIRIFQSSGVQIGGTASGEANTIAGNLRHGIKLGSTSSGSSNLISGNSIFANGDLGIDLDRTVNDPDPIPDPLGPDPNSAYANQGQNQPELCNGANIPGCALPSYNSSNGKTSFGWRLASAPNTPYTIEVFASDVPDTSGSGEGQYYLGSFTTATNASAIASGTQEITPATALDTRGRYLSLTARPTNLIDPPGPSVSGPANHTSEFSNAVAVPAPGNLQFEAANLTVNEAAGTATVQVQRAGGAQGAVSVSYSASAGTATDPPDFIATSGTLSWANNDSAPKTFTVTILNDALDENDETIHLILSAPTGGASVGIPSVAVLSILDDDPLPTLSIADLNLPEGQSGTTPFNFQLTLSPASGRPVTIQAASADGTATLLGNDYQQLVPTTLVINPGQTSATASVAVIGDTVVEPNETFLVNLTLPQNAVLGDAQGVGTILADESPNVSIADASGLEGASGVSMLAFTLTRTSAAGAASVTVQSGDGSATVADGDYLGLPPTVINFANGELLKAVNVSILGDLKFESDETFVLSLSNPVNLNISDGVGEGSIGNDDPQPSISISDLTLAEGNAGTTSFFFTLALSNPSDRTISVRIALADGSATLANNDFLPLANSVLSLERPTEVQLVSVVGDLNAEGNETFFVNLSQPTNASISDGQAVGTILDDDGVGTLIFANGFE